MNATELLSAVNEHCEKIGSPPVTKRQLRDWVDEELVQGAKAVGRRRGQNPEWRYSESAFIAAKRIAELRTYSIRRATLLRIYLWIEGDEKQTHRVKECIVNEFVRFRRRVNRNQPWDLDMTFGSTRTPTEQARAEKQFGKPAFAFEQAKIVVDKQLMIEIASIMHWGSNQKPTAEIFNIYQKAISESSFSNTLKNLTLGQVGLIGSPEFIAMSGEAGIQLCTNAHLMIAKECYYCICNWLIFSWLAVAIRKNTTMMSAYSTAIGVIQDPEFLTSYIAVMAIGARRAESVSP